VQGILSLNIKPVDVHKTLCTHCNINKILWTQIDVKLNTYYTLYDKSCEAHKAKIYEEEVRIKCEYTDLITIKNYEIYPGIDASRLNYVESRLKKLRSNREDSGRKYPLIYLNGLKPVPVHRLSTFDIDRRSERDLSGTHFRW